MFSVFNRFINWFLMKEEEGDASMQSPAQLMHGISDVNILLAEPSGKFPSEEIHEAVLAHIISSLEGRAGLTIRRTDKSFSRTSSGNLTEQFNKVTEKGRELLEEENCDLLIWGHIEPEHQCVRWYFLSAQPPEINLGIPSFSESLMLSFEAEKAAIDVLYATIFAATAPNHPSHAIKIGEHLLGSIDPLTKLPGGLGGRKTSPLAKTSAMGMCSVVLANMARRGEEMGWFEPAIKAFDTWDSMIDKEKAPLEWALVKNHHGWLYEEMANHDEDELAVEHIEKAISIFEDVCSIFTPKEYPMEWAAVQLRIAGTCARIGRTLSEPEYLQKAARYYRKSMDIFTHAEYPLNWADSMSRMAKTMMLHGQLVKGAQSLEQAGVAFQAILKVYTQDKYPALWASTHNNLGATLFALAKRDPSTHAWLDHALICFNEARSYYEEIDKPQMVHIIDKNIARAQELKDQEEEKLNNDLLN